MMLMTATMQFNIAKQQRGLSLLLVLVLLSMTISASLFFHQRMVSSTRISGSTRDNSESMLLAESAMEMLRGGFTNTLCSVPDCSVDGPDSQRVGTIAGKMNDPAALDAALLAANVRYIFYIGAADQLSPNILQRVANAGAGIGGAKCTITPGTRSVSAANCNLDINTLFGGNNYRPLLFTTKESDPNIGLLLPSTQTNWQAELDRAGNAGAAAATWIELTVNGGNAKAVDMWVEAVARVGVATSYLQRYVGTYYPASTALGSLAALVEASNVNRR